jgi:putative DNA primase/helicase
MMIIGSKQENASLFADQWIKDYYLLTDEDSKIMYYYKNGVYHPNAERLIEELVEKEFSGICTNKFVSEIIGMIKRRTYSNFDTSTVDPELINVRNGLLNIKTGELSEHTPELFFTVQLPVKYDPDASCPKIQKFFSEVVAPEDIPLLEEIVGWTLWRPYDVHKAIMLWGRGRNGKGAFLRLLEAFLGIENVSHVSLPKLVGDRFAPIDLVGKAANIFGDLPAKDLSGTENFKMATGQDTIRVENKFTKSFDYRNTAKLFFSANQLPKSPDDTDAFYERWIVIKFPYRFGTPERPFNTNLDNELSTQMELSGLLNLALKALKRMKSNGWKFSYSLTLENVKAMYQRLSDPVFAFLQDCCEPCEEGHFIKADLYKHFKAYAAENNLSPRTSTKFIQTMEDQSYIPVEPFKPEIDGAQRKAWKGIRLKIVIDSSPAQQLAPITERL